MWNSVCFCVTYSTATYVFYFVEFYMNLIPTDSIYSSQNVLSVADLLSVLTFSLVSKYFPLRWQFISASLGIAVSAYALFYKIKFKTRAFEPGDEVSDYDGYEYAVILLFLRLYGVTLYGLSNTAISTLTPTLLVGSVYSVINLIARPLASVAPIVAELIPNPSILTVALSFASIVTSFRIVDGTHTD